MLLSQLLAAQPELDHELSPEEGDIVTDVVSLVRVVRIDEDVTSDALIIGTAAGATGIAQYGLVRTACLHIESWMLAGGRPDDWDTPPPPTEETP